MKKAELLKLNNELLKVIQSQLERINKLENDVDFWRNIAQINKNTVTPVDPYIPYPSTPNPHPEWLDRYVWC